ncbi:hypothetical protein D3C71_512180 [compost metagenome]
MFRSFEKLQRTAIDLALYAIIEGRHGFEQGVLQKITCLGQCRRRFAGKEIEIVVAGNRKRIVFFPGIGLLEHHHIVLPGKIMRRHAPAYFAQDFPEIIDDFRKIGSVGLQAFGDDEMGKFVAAAKVVLLIKKPVAIRHEIHVHGACQRIDLLIQQKIRDRDYRLRRDFQIRITGDGLPLRTVLNAGKRLPVSVFGQSLEKLFDLHRVFEHFDIPIQAAPSVPEPAGAPLPLFLMVQLSSCRRMRFPLSASNTRTLEWSGISVTICPASRGRCSLKAAETRNPCASERITMSEPVFSTA